MRGAYYVSTLTRLEPGGAISTGTSAGVGHRRNPPVFMNAGDVLEVEVSGIDTLRNTVIDELGGRGHALWPSARVQREIAYRRRNQ